MQNGMYLESPFEDYDNENERKKEWLSNDERKLRRALHRFYTGYGVRGKYVLVTLTTPEGWSVDLHHAWRKMVLRMRRRGLPREYYAVREWNKRGTCEHLHVVFRADFIPVKVLREQWCESLGWPVELHGYVWTHIERTYGGARGMACYLAKYLAKGQFLTVGGEDLDCSASQRPEKSGKRVFWYSAGWIVRRWCGVTRYLRRLGWTLDSARLEELRAGSRDWMKCLAEGLTNVEGCGRLSRWELSILVQQVWKAMDGLCMPRYEAALRLRLSGWSEYDGR